MKPDGAITIAFALITFACSFDDDRSLGSMNAAQLSNSGGTTNGGPSTTVVSKGGTNTFVADSTTSTPNVVNCRNNADCSTSEYCQFDLKCGKDAVAGSCRPLPTRCALPTGKQSVCGCDGVFYESDCEAWRASVSVAEFTQCPDVACTTEDDCQQFSETCAKLYNWSRPQALCPQSHCDCGQNTILQ
jgi:hypothetical protein